uniref:Uncharacterized protein n=1 Tax=Streptomyces sp. NBC_00049 TaxID=2903617 RepID=A0AAU2JYM8_9ACTN
MKYVSRALRELYSSLNAAGWMWLGMSTMGPPLLPLPGAGLDEPPQGHPERLRPDIPLSRTELALQQQLLTPIGERE